MRSGGSPMVKLTKLTLTGLETNSSQLATG